MQARHLTIATVLGLALLAGGCGGDDEKASSTEPEFTVPSTPTAPVTTPTVTTPTTTTPTQTTDGSSGAPTTPGNSGGTPATSGTSGGTQSSTGSTITPDEAAENFERYCRENPEACGE